MKQQKYEKVVEGEGQLLFISVASFLLMPIVWELIFLRGFLMGWGIMSGLFYWKNRKVYWRKMR